MLPGRCWTWRVFLLLMSLSSLCHGQAVLSFVQTSFVVREGQQFFVQVLKTGTATGDVNVVVEILNTEAFGAEDFIGDSQPTVFKAGSETLFETVVFTVRDDDIPEADETFAMQLAVSTGNGILGDPRLAQVTIIANDDAYGIFSIVTPSPVIVQELVDPVPVLINVQRTRGAFSTVAVSYEVVSANSNAVPGADLSPAAGTMVFNDGEAVKPLELRVMPDDLPENDESFTVQLVAVSGGSSVDANVQPPQLNLTEVTVTIRLNDAPIRFAEAQYLMDEGTSDVIMEVTVYRGLDQNGLSVVGPVNRAATVDYYFVPGTAQLGFDFQADNGTIGFSDGITQSTVRFQLLSDPFPEVAESFQIVLTNPSGEVVLADPSVVTITINANDDSNGVLSLLSPEGAMFPVFTVNEDTTSEFSKFVVVRNGGFFGTVTVRWEISRNDSSTESVNRDLLPTNGVVFFNEGDKENVIVINIQQDLEPEPAERFVLRLIPESVTGGARVEGILAAQLIIEDSDDAYGVIEFVSDSDQNLEASASDNLPRLLRLSLRRFGGLLGNVMINFTAEFIVSGTAVPDVFLANMPAYVTMPAEQTGFTFQVPIRDEAFLRVGGTFRVTLNGILPEDELEVGSYNSPRVGSKNIATISVPQSLANGEVGFADVAHLIGQEPDGVTELVSRVVLPLTRDGTNGEMSILWTMSGSGANADQVTQSDITPMSGTVVMVSGQSTASIVLEVLPDDLPEMDEELTVLLVSVEPQISQRLRPGSVRLKVIIAENDNPGGIFELAPFVGTSFIVEEEGEAIQLSVIRTGGALVTRELQYLIEPNGEAEFYGSTNVMVFAPGQMEHNATVIAKGDGVPELSELFSLKLQSFGESVATLGAKTRINITVLGNDDPYGIFQFSEQDQLILINETKGTTNETAQIPVMRNQGRFGAASVEWYVVNAEANEDLWPLSGTLLFPPGVAMQYITIISVADNIPEGPEFFTINLTNPTGGARLAFPTTTVIRINENDDAIFFREPVNPSVPEPGTVRLVVGRNGTADYLSTVRYQTVDDTAAEIDNDYIPIRDGQIVFNPGETDGEIFITILDDNAPEGEETFFVDLFNPTGDASVYGAPRATVTIQASDGAAGIFRFSPPYIKSVREGDEINFDVVRERGKFGVVQLYWQLYDNVTQLPLPAGQDFRNTSGYVTFEDRQQVGAIILQPLQDNIPEYTEMFSMQLANVTGGFTNGEFPSLATFDQEVYLEVEQNDDPYGVFAFPSYSREVSVAEDFYPGNEDSTMVQIEVERQQGSFSQATVVWEIFSYNIAGAGNLPQLKDLLFLGTVPPSVVQDPTKQRPRTGTMVLEFSGCSDCYVTVPRDHQPTRSDIESGFCISAWIQAAPATDGYILAKTTPDGDRIYYAVKVTVSNQGATFIFRYSVAGIASNLIVTKPVAVRVHDGVWHHVLLNVDSGTAVFYIDGVSYGTDRLAATSVVDGVGTLLVGAIAPGNDQFQGFLQDVRIFNRRLDPGEIREIHQTPSREDVQPISGYMVYMEGSQLQNITIFSVDDTEEEANEAFAVRLISAKGGARVSETDNAAILTVLKSDNANGLFGFSGPCIPYFSENEDSVFNCPVERRRGDAGTVTLTWEVVQDIGGASVLAQDDFVNATGNLVFIPGERQKTITFEVTNDEEPELTEEFDVSIVNLVSDDGLVGTTGTSGASVETDRGVNNITILESDHPFGLFQFSTGAPPAIDAPMVALLTEPPRTTVPEEVGVEQLLVVRAQGLLGQTSVEWRTIDATAKSSGKTPPDYVAGVDRLVFLPGQRFAYIDVTILDNSIPESEKAFLVELLNPAGGAAVGIGSAITVTIQHSDQAFGVFQFAEESLNVVADEMGDSGFNVVNLRVVREGGSIRTINVTWQVMADPGNDLVVTSGVLSFSEGVMEAEIPLQIRGDTTPELDETFLVQLTDVSVGSLGEAGKLNASVTILANDDPYGVFIISETDRPIRTEESLSDVNLTIERVQQSGFSGMVEVSYRTLTSTEIYSFLPGVDIRAEQDDFVNASGSVILAEGVSSAMFNITVLDDEVPEIDETVFVMLTGVKLLEPAQDREVEGSPRLGRSSEIYGQIIINQNDQPNGLLQLSDTSVLLPEDFVGPPVKVVRAGGAFGQVSVKVEVIPGSATYGLDYSVSSTDVVMASGEREKGVPVEIINDRLPELAESFTVRLVDQITGGGSLGPLIQTLVTIEASDDPNGLFAFEYSIVTAQEPPNFGSVAVQLTVVRKGGTLGVVAVDWESEFNGDSPVTDLSPVSGTVYFVSNEARQFITINILPDDDPEGVENIIIRLVGANNGGHVDEVDNEMILAIQPNDNPHGTIQFASPNFILEERDTTSEQNIQVSRSGGTYGQLQIYYRTSQIDILTEMVTIGFTLFEFFEEPLPGKLVLPLSGTRWNVRDQPDPLEACATFCLLTEACESFDFNSTFPDCNWFTVADTTYLQERTGYVYYKKSKQQADALYARIAQSGTDYTPVPEESIILRDGANTGQIPLTIRADNLPELAEKFMVHLSRVELVGGPPSDPSNIPKLGTLNDASVTIASNDAANGMFRIYSKDPRATNNGRNINVEERDKYSVELVIERQGGTIGTVSVSWDVNFVLTSATKNVDYIADGARLTFGPGETMRTLTVGIEDDDIPEPDENLVVQLTNPQNGALISSQDDQVTITIMANDHVAGLIGFTETSYLTREGDIVTLTIKRSQPALGEVGVDWTIDAIPFSEPPPMRFVNTSGTVYYKEGELLRVVILQVKADNLPKINQAYTVTLQNVRTEGVRSTGEADVDPQTHVAVVTIEGGNDPHGVFTFAPATLERRVEEGNHIVQLQVDRKFGAIGIVRVYYDVTTGTIRPLSDSLQAAAAMMDFEGQRSGSIIMNDGQNSGNIEVQLREDEIPEVDEIFLVTLTSVELLNPVNTTFRPRLDTSGVVAEVIIGANDGTQGEVIFRGDSVSVQVNESNTNIPLTIQRTKGTFGHVSVFCFAQSVGEGARAKSDYNFEPREVEFLPGQIQQMVIVEIFDDVEPEPNELFEIILASPKNGLMVGDPHRAVITIRASDGASGAVTFGTRDEITLNEPTAISSENSKVQVQLTRAPGIFGVVNVPFKLLDMNGREDIVDLTPKSGYITFRDREGVATLELEAVADNEPEEEETFRLILQPPTGGATFGDITERMVVIERNDAPYGLLEIYPTGTRNSTVEVEENSETMYFDVYRTRGSLDRISVDVVTTPISAKAKMGKTMYLSMIQQLRARQLSGWSGFKAGDVQYLVMLSSQRQAPLTTAIGGTGSDGPVISSDVTQTVLYRWQGTLVPVQSVETDGAAAAIGFQIGGIQYMAVANGGGQNRYETKSRVYRISDSGQLSLYQEFRTRGASDMAFFKQGGDGFLVIANYMDNSRMTSINSDVYQWDNFMQRFSNVPTQYLSTRGARAAEAIVIDESVYLVIANYMDSQTQSYQINSIVYKLDPNQLFTIHQQIPTRGAMDLTSYMYDDDTYLAIANQRDNAANYAQAVTVFVWNSQEKLFLQVQEIPTIDVKSVDSYLDAAGLVHLVIANRGSNSAIYRWDPAIGQFNQTWTGPSSIGLLPVVVDHKDQPTVIMAQALPYNLNAPPTQDIYQVSMLEWGQSDFVPRTTTLSFEPGQVQLQTSVTILEDEIPEDTESFAMQLTNPRGGAEIGPNKEVLVQILSNDDGHGIVEFAEDSVIRRESEMEGQDNIVQFNVVRHAGIYGRVVVSWRASGDHNSIYDIEPLEGRVEFADGQSAATISITIKDDPVAEIDETTLISLMGIVEGGTSLAGREARIGEESIARLIVMANDSPNGVVSWEDLRYVAAELDGSDTSVTLHIIREQGTLGSIRVSFLTVRDILLPSKQQAVSGIDYVPSQTTVDMAQGVSRVPVQITILADDDPEVTEYFLVNITDVQLLGPATTSGVGPSIKRPGDITTVSVAENDNARGIVQFNVERNLESRVDTYEGVGSIQLRVQRSVGFFGDVAVNWRASPKQATTEDFSPSSGEITFAEGQTEAFIDINIIDDTEPENDIEDFDVQLISVASGGATIGPDKSVRVGILKNDSPFGVFSFVNLQKSVRESQYENDPNGEVTFDIYRDGIQGVASVQWRLNAAAFHDFVEPLSGTETFGPGEQRKTITLRTKQDNELEGEERFTISLLPADSVVDISPSDGEATVVILPDPGAGGIISVLPVSNFLLMGEPTADYDGKAEVKLTRGSGMYGEVRVTWQINRRDPTAFQQTQGEITFADRQQNVSISIQTKDDSVPELRETFQLLITSATGGATVDTNANSVEILMVASDYPHGLFEFNKPPEQVISEEANQVIVTVVRNLGHEGQARVTYQTTAGTASDTQNSEQDFIPTSGTLMFLPNEWRKTISVDIVNDDRSEGPETFFVNLTQLELLSPTNNNYSLVNGLQLDMAPAIGPLSAKTVIIDKSDNAEGIFQFDTSALNFVAYEDEGVAKIPVIRGPGTYGTVSARFTTQNGTAIYGVDYLLSDGEVFLTDGMDRNTINVTILDDTEREFAEQFLVKLVSVSGGSLLGSRTTASVTIAKSDYPNGKFSFVGQTELTIANPAIERTLTFTIERTGGLIGKQTLRWRIMGPNNPNLVLEETNDIGYRSPEDRETTQGSLSWEADEAGEKYFTVIVKAHSGWEIAKVFDIAIYDIQGFPASSGNGEPSPTADTLTLTIQKYGDPNGIVRFEGVATESRVVDEPTVGSRQLVFPIYRREGTNGDIEVYWRVVGPLSDPPDFEPTNDVAIIEGDKRNGNIIINIMADEEAELDETFVIELTKVDGGAEVDTNFNTTRFTIRYNDYPHGRFGILSEYQTVVVSSSDMRRMVRLNLTRYNGLEGRVRVTYSIVYDQAQSGISYLPSAGSVSFETGVRDGIEMVDIDSNVYLGLGATFTVTLESATYIGVGVTMPPELIPGRTMAKVVVPQVAANSEVGFKSAVISVDEETNLAEVTLVRTGSYGEVHIAWVAGFPDLDQPQGFERGRIVPGGGTVSMFHAVDNKTFTIQLEPRESEPELFAVNLPSEPQAPNVEGGARLQPGGTLTRIEPYGVVRFKSMSREVKTTEPDKGLNQVPLHIERLYGSQDNIQIRYRAFSDTAQQGLDFVEVDNGAVNMDPGKTSSTIYVQIKSDSLPEADEYFFVNFTSVTLLPTVANQEVSPRLSSMYSSAKITISSNSDPFGVLSIVAANDGRAQEQGKIKLTILRTGGVFGDISVTVRTVGGREPWDREFDPSVPQDTQVNDTIAQVLHNRNRALNAIAGQDYEIMNQVVFFKAGENRKEVELSILNDPLPEDDEYVFVYLKDSDAYRIAKPSTDNGQKGYAVVTIEKNDNWNGLIGFFSGNSTIVYTDEDEGTPARMTIERLNAYFGALRVEWSARIIPTVEGSESLDLSNELEGGTTGIEPCEANQHFCVFDIKLKDDDRPENETKFEIVLVDADPGAKVDSNRNVATIVMKASDNPNGLVQFAPNSRMVYVNRQDNRAVLKVERKGYTGKVVSIRYSTIEIGGPETVAGVSVFSAVPNQDYSFQSSDITFKEGQDSYEIVIPLDYRKAPSNPGYPRMFRVGLSDITNGAIFGHHMAQVTIVNEGDRNVWDIWSFAHIDPVDEPSIDGVMQQLSLAVRGPISHVQMPVVSNILELVLDNIEGSDLSFGTQGSIMDVFCSLLNPAHGNDATLGRWQLSKLLERFAFSMLSGSKYKCPGCCTEGLDFSITSPACEYVQFKGAKWYPSVINGKKYTAKDEDFFQTPVNLLPQQVVDQSTSARCLPVVYIQYSSVQWFKVKSSTNLLHNRAFQVSVKDQPSGALSTPVTFRIHTSNPTVPAKRAECVYFDETDGDWTSGDNICAIQNNLALGLDNYVDCACRHMSAYSVMSKVRNPDMVGYPVWFHISCFICIVGLLLAIISHHVCSFYALFSANLLMHLCFSVLATELCYVIDAYISPIHIFLDPPDGNNYRCIVMALFLHFFFLAQFTWMMTLAINFWKILVLNDEHTDRKYVQHFLLGWGLPFVLVILFYLIAYLIYRFSALLPVSTIYGDVTLNEDICFITNPYAALGGVVAPALICLMVVGIVFIQAFQVAPQWQAYDDVYRGRYNLHEIRTILLFWALIVITWLWGGLHMAYSQLWMLVLFCIFNIAVGVYAFVVYAALRNPCLPCFKPQKATYSVNYTMSDPGDGPFAQQTMVPSMVGSVKGSRASLINDNWEKDSIAQSTNLRVKRSATTNGNIYVIPPTPSAYGGKAPSQRTDDRESQDFDELIFALKTGGYSPSEASHPGDRDLDNTESPNSQYEMRRISIADTHL